MHAPRGRLTGRGPREGSAAAHVRRQAPFFLGNPGLRGPPPLWGPSVLLRSADQCPSLLKGHLPPRHRLDWRWTQRRVPQPSQSTPKINPHNPCLHDFFLPHVSLSRGLCFPAILNPRSALSFSSKNFYNSLVSNSLVSYPLCSLASSSSSTCSDLLAFT